MPFATTRGFVNIFSIRKDFEWIEISIKLPENFQNPNLLPITVEHVSKKLRAFKNLVHFQIVATYHPSQPSSSASQYICSHR